MLSRKIFSTLEKALTEGEFLIDVKYNGKDLYDNHWEFCTIDENQKKRQVFCPYKPGFYEWATDKKIPKFIPKVWRPNYFFFVNKYNS